MARRTGDVIVDVDRCKGCGTCVTACAFHCLELGAERNRPGYHHVHFVPGSGCTACGVCLYVCPEPAALTVRAVSEEVA